MVLELANDVLMKKLHHIILCFIDQPLYIDEILKRRKATIEEIGDRYLTIDLTVLRKLYNYFRICKQMTASESMIVKSWVEKLYRQQSFSVGLLS